MNAHRDFHTWLSWFGNTGIDVSFSLRSSALLLPLFLFVLPSSLSFSSFLQYWQAWQFVTAFSFFYFETESTTASWRAGLCPVPISSSPTHRQNQYAFMPIMGATVGSFMDSFLSAVRFPCPSTLFSLAQGVRQEGIFTWKSLQLWETFPLTHVLTRDLRHP